MLYQGLTGSLNKAIFLGSDQVWIISSDNGTIATHNATAKFIGEPFGLPSRLNEMGVAMFPWDGKLESGSYAPEGRYRFVVRALRGYLAMPPSTCTVRQGL
ncbi:hypothetical protein E4U22_006522 [Claviceps purpurea]|nr:hypothetical protein E4U28_007041 [Claviceps purpurea]KAG6213663.1 hypothetical protein E4U34_006544 [Claviceps purpurea]KAG6242434.1 hypothetical protein E4U23_006896 [Claviceps purpurea]KAG6285368.1 hypothetical protein E4U46_005918 [Claviceps purpurea]KAG6317085.1 hypothetical protein E4U22_006522 [Claviceps purpurea]